MSKIDIDLDINNYNLDDILGLFKIDNNFDTNDVKKCYKMVLKLHPDKSGLDKEYFLFYTKAFKILKNVFEYKNKRNSHLDEYKSKIEYLDIDEQDVGKKLLVDNLHKKKGEDFNKWFNRAFEKINISNLSNGGYGDWLKSDNDEENLDIKSVREMHDIINKKKESLSALVKIDKISQLSHIGNINELDNGRPESYSASVFSKLAYDDLKIAHTESVIPVCNRDYEKIQKFNNIGSLREFRNTQNLKPMSKQQAENELDKNNSIEDERNTQLAYRLTKQAEESEKANTKLWNMLRTLK
jgi:hypothetical protein